MALVGDLGSVDLAQVFQVLSQNQKDGVLDIFRGDEHRGLRVRQGALTLQFDRDAYEERVVDLLRRLNRVSEEKLILASANRHETSDSLLDVLVSLQVVTQDEIDSLFRERMAEEVYDLFSWHDARFEFHEGAERLEGAPGNIDERLFFPSDAVVMEAVHRLDEWTRIREHVGDESDVFECLLPLTKFEDDFQESVFRATDGMRSVLETARSLGRSVYETSYVYARLHRLGVIARVDPEKFADRGRQALAAGRALEAANLFDRASAAGVDFPESLHLAGRAWEAANAPSAAAERYLAAGDALAANGELEKALESYRHAHGLVPTHLGAWRKAVDLSLDVATSTGVGALNVNAAIEEASTLATVLTELGQPDAAVETLERALVRDPGNAATKRTLIAFMERSGNQVRMCELLEALSNDLYRQGDPVGAAGCLQRVLRLYPERRDLSGRIRDLFQRDEQRRTWRKAIAATFISSTIAGALGMLLFSREKKAFAEFSATDVEERLHKGDFSGAKARLEEFVATHPLTVAGSRAKEQIVVVERLASESAQLREIKRAEERRALNERIAKSEEALRKSDELARSGRLKDALDALNGAIQQAPREWTRMRDAQKNAADLEHYLGGASALAADADKYERAGDLSAARRALRDLVGKYPLTVEARAARFPFLVESTPAGASLQVDGEAAGSTPAVVRLAPTRKQHEVRCAALGYSPSSQIIDILEDAPVRVRLGRAPEWSAPSAAALPVPLAVAAGRAWVPLASGKIACFGRDAEPAWTAQIPSSGEILGSAALADGAQVYATTDGTVACLEPQEAKRRWKMNIGSGLRVPPAAGADGIYVACDDSKIRLLSADQGLVVREWKASTRPTGQICIVQGMILVGAADGRVAAFDAANPKTDERLLSIGAPMVSALAADNRIIVSGDDGRIVGVDVPSFTVAFEKPGGRIAQPRLAGGGGRVYADVGGKLCAIDPATGDIAASAAFPSEPVGQPAVSRDLVCVALQDGSVYALQRSDLTVAWTWPGMKTPATVAADEESLWVVSGKSVHRFDLRPDRADVK